MKNKNFLNKAKSFLSLAAVLCSTIPAIAADKLPLQSDIPSAESILIDDAVNKEAKRPKVA
ncbi:hypothetical protein ABTM18_19345, partial [Acinetobacter baumannii]